MTAGASTACTACGEPTTDDDHFCESCGHPVDGVSGPTTAGVAGVPTLETPAMPGGVCAHGQVDADGYCELCGTLVPVARTEYRAASAALVTDPGRHYARNQDAGTIGSTGGWTYTVVCDGVSTAPRSAEAARLAVAAAAAVLDARLADDPDGTDALHDAAGAAGVAVRDLANGRTGPTGAPACTFVAAVLHPTGRLHVAHLGDSRAYWLPDRGDLEQLTEDDSWAAEAIAAGIEPDAAYADVRAHAVTGWLGLDAGPLQAHLGAAALTGPGLVLVCSDGLWNYRADLPAMAAAVRGADEQAGGDLLGAARALVDLALDAGGRDNITVALLRHDPEGAVR